MKTLREYSIPDDKLALLRKAQGLEWLSILFLCSVVVLMYVAMGSSQAMKAAWAEDLLSLIPPIAFLIATHYREKPATKKFPYGYLRSTTIAFLVASVALSVMGTIVLLDSVMTLVSQEHPTIGAIQVFGQTIWHGWLMIIVLLYSVIPAIILGRLKLPLAHELYEKTLHADASMNKADWLTGLAAIAGIVGVGFGWWWADATAALIISFDIVKDGLSHTRNSIADLMDQRPSKVDSSKPEGVVKMLRDHLAGLSWVREVDVRLRTEGHVFTGEAFIVPADTEDLPQKLHDTTRSLRNLDWRLFDVVLTVTPQLENKQ